MGPRGLLALWAGKLVFACLRLLGRGASTLPGRIALRLDPALTARLGRHLAQGAALVTGTNGKTTTSTMLAGLAEAGGRRVAHNRTGANLHTGVATTLLTAATWTGAGRDLAVLEVDEASVPAVSRALRPRVAVVTNFFRDQLDRYGELQTAVAMVRRGLGAMAAGGTVVLNADDPLAAALGSSDAVAHLKPLYFGIEADLPDAAAPPAAPAQSAGETATRRGLVAPAGVAAPAAAGAGRAAGGSLAPSDAGHCPRCGRAFRYESRYYAHLGHYACDGCGWARPRPEVALVALHENWRGTGESGGPLRWDLQLATPRGPLSFQLSAGGLYNVYNALAAAAGALALGIAPERVAESLTAFRSSFGRMEAVAIDGRTVLLALVKNPVGLSEVVRTVARDPDPRKGVLIAINDRYADGRDVSWLWDADIERLGATELSAILAAGSRAEDMALRLKYAGVPSERVMVEPDLEAALRRGAAAVPPGGTLYVLPTYTAMLALRQAMSRHGLARQFWQV